MGQRVVSAIHSTRAVRKGNEAENNMTVGGMGNEPVFLQQSLLDQDVLGNKANRCQVPGDLNKIYSAVL